MMKWNCRILMLFVSNIFGALTVSSSLYEKRENYI